jgi:hypothetical protein
VTVQDKPRIQVNDAILSLIDPAQLVVNGSFDVNNAPTKKVPDSWTTLGTMQGDKVRADGATTVSNSAPNAFRFKVGLGEPAGSILFQAVNLAVHPIGVGDQVVLTAMLD